MSQLLETIAQQLGPAALGQMSQQLGAKPDQLNSAIAVALPALIGGLSKNTQQAGGAENLLGALMKDHSAPVDTSLVGGLMSAFGGSGSRSGGGLETILGAAMNMMGGSNNSTAPAALNGSGILSHIFGGSQPQVEQNVAKASGVDMGIIAKLLPMLAPLVMRALANKTQEKGMDSSSLAGFLSQEKTQIEEKAPNQLSGLSALLDSNGDGNVSDELMSMGSKLLSSGALSNLFK